MTILLLFSLLILLLISLPIPLFACVPHRRDYQYHYGSSNPIFNPNMIGGIPAHSTILRYGQFHPNMAEISDDASGKRRKPIRRRSKRWTREMIYYKTTNEVVFLDEERGKRHGRKTHEDHFMSKRCFTTLRRLALIVRMSIPAQKYNLKVLVLEAWEPVRRHRKRRLSIKDSLHSEGRALDLTLYVPVEHRLNWTDTEHLGQLALWSIQAGFDWVHYENRHYIHVSCRSTESENWQSPRCFPGDSVVISGIDNRLIRMTDLKVDDVVKTVDSEGKIGTSPVLLFLDRNPSAFDKFLRLHLDDGRRLRLSPRHLIYRVETRGGDFNSTMPNWRKAPTYAEDLNPGDFVLVVNGNNNSLSPAEIRFVDIVDSIGAYAPLSNQGTLIVDGFVVSCYASTKWEKLAHFSMMPIRILHRLFVSFAHQRDLHPYSRFLMLIADYIDYFIHLELYA